MKPLVFQSDFGLVDGAVSAMYGVAYSVNPDLKMHDLTHDITPYSIWEASYRLIQTVSYWPDDTVFVSVVDPGVGTDRKSVVARTHSGKYIVTPDNGTLTHVLRLDGISAVREIDEQTNRLPNSGESYTFYGRDVYAYTGARLAAGVISFGEVGPELPVEDLVRLPVVEPYLEGAAVCGTVDVLDVRFGSLWTNIPRELFLKTGAKYGDRLSITIENDTRTVYRNIIQFARSFADVYIGEALAYVNSLDCMAVAINQGSFARAYNIGLIGHALIDFSAGWCIWWSWVIASGVFGLLMGFAAKLLKMDEAEMGKKGLVKFNISQVVCHLLCWFLVAPVLDVYMMGEPWDKLLAQGLVAGIANAVTTAIVGSLLCVAYAATKTKAGSLTKE